MFHAVRPPRNDFQLNFKVVAFSVSDILFDSKTRRRSKKRKKKVFLFNVQNLWCTTFREVLFILCRFFYYLIFSHQLMDAIVIFHWTTLKNNNCLMSLKRNSCNSVRYKHGAATKTDLYFLLFYYFATQTKRRKYFLFRRLQ